MIVRNQIWTNVKLFYNYTILFYNVQKKVPKINKLYENFYNIIIYVFQTHCIVLYANNKKNKKKQFLYEKNLLNSNLNSMLLFLNKSYNKRFLVLTDKYKWSGIICNYSIVLLSVNLDYNNLSHKDKSFSYIKHCCLRHTKHYFNTI